jgi:hypothetical protein
VAAILLLLVIAVSTLAYQAWWHLTASHTHVMGRIATSLVGDYVRTHNGRWPKSWAELETVTPTRWHNDPQTIQILKKRVHVDFERLVEVRVDQYRR